MMSDNLVAEGRKVQGDDMYVRIFIAEPSRDFSALTQYGEDFVFVTSGLEKIEDIQAKVEVELLKFNPDQDALVPIGRVATNMIIGVTLSKLFPGQTIKIAVYKDKDYIFLPLSL